MWAYSIQVYTDMVCVSRPEIFRRNLYANFNGIAFARVELVYWTSVCATIPVGYSKSRNVGSWYGISMAYRCVSGMNGCSVTEIPVIIHNFTVGGVYNIMIKFY